MQLLSTLIIFALPLTMVGVVSYRRGLALYKHGDLTTKKYVANLVLCAGWLPLILGGWDFAALIYTYTPDACGSWWLGANPENCTLTYYLLTRIPASLIFLLAPLAFVSLLVTLLAFKASSTRAT